MPGTNATIGLPITSSRLTSYHLAAVATGTL